MGDEDGLGLAAETVNAIGEDAAHVAGAVIELTHGNRHTHAGIGHVGAGDLLHRHRAVALGGTTGHGQQRRGGEARQQDFGQCLHRVLLG